MSEHDPLPLPNTAPVAASLPTDKPKSGPLVPRGVANLQRQITAVQRGIEGMDVLLDNAQRRKEDSDFKASTAMRNRLAERRTLLQKFLGKE